MSAVPSDTLGVQNVNEVLVVYSTAAFERHIEIKNDAEKEKKTQALRLKFVCLCTECECICGWGPLYRPLGIPNHQEIYGPRS